MLEALIGQAPGLVTIMEGPELRITYTTQAVVELFGHPLVGSTLEEIFPGTRAVEAARQVYATGESVSIIDTPLYRTPIVEPSRFFNRSYTALKDRSGTVQGVVIVAHEVTGAVRARLEEEATELRRREELERVFALFDAAPVMLATLEAPDWKLVMANGPLRRLLGDRATGYTLRPVLSADNPTLQAIDRVYASGKPETIETYAQQSQFANNRRFSVSLVPVPNSDGVITHVLASAVEITEHHRARQVLEAQARDLDAARQEAVAAARAKDQFLAMLGHELRNPLQPMLTTVQIMRLDGDASPGLEMLERDVRYLTRLVDDLLDISRFSRGMITLQLEPLDLRSVITRGIELASPLLEQRHHRVNIDLPSRALGVSGDLQRLAQVVSNLIQNAAKFSDPGSAIRIACESSNKRITLRVSDDGIGISREMLDRIFDAFVQADRPIAGPGGSLGLGLAIVKSLVEAHGGTVSAHSEGLGRGSTFVVQLPAIEMEVAARSASDPPRVLRRDARLQPLHVLVVDDNPQVADVLRSGLTAVGYQVTIAYDAPSALTLAAADPPHIALLDIGLPGMDGYELGKALRVELGIPLVAITGYGQSVDRDRSLSAGFAAHRVKPVDLGELALLIEKLVGISPPSGQV